MLLACQTDSERQGLKINKCWQKPRQPPGQSFCQDFHRENHAKVNIFQLSHKHKPTFARQFCPERTFCRLTPRLRHHCLKCIRECICECIIGWRGSGTRRVYQRVSRRANPRICMLFLPKETALTQTVAQMVFHSLAVIAENMVHPVVVRSSSGPGEVVMGNATVVIN